MMEAFHNLVYGFGIALTPTNFLYCFLGAVLGTLVGILPGIGPVTAIAILLPLTFKMPAIAALIMLAGIYYGSKHAGATTSIMLNMPGEPEAIVICFDGYPMARQGRAGPALCMVAMSSFFAGCICILVITFFSPPLARAALSFQSPEYTVTILLALVGAAALSRKSLLSTMGMAVLGILIGTVGTDINSGVVRFTLGESRLAEGISFIPIAMGLFAFVEICYTLGSPHERTRVKATLRDLVPKWLDIKTCTMPVLRGTALGAAFGILPGTGPLISSFGAYAIERKLAKEPQRFGQGAIEGVAAPEAAANAAAFTHFIPMLTLGIPAGATMALMLAAMLIQGIPPGPQVMTAHPDLFWGLIASMWIGNLMLLILNLPLVGIWIKMLETPYRFIYPLIIVFSLIGIYSERNQAFDVLICAGVVVVGYVMEKLDCSPGPLVLGVILGPILEENLRRSLLLSRGDPTVFLTRPISLTVVILIVALLVLFMLPAIKRTGKTIKAAEAQYKE
ncbi:MAG: tripartite tricarboxylate transporter permease [Dongiaceae bacterium]